MLQVFRLVRMKQKYMHQFRSTVLFFATWPPTSWPTKVESNERKMKQWNLHSNFPVCSFLLFQSFVLDFVFHLMLARMKLPPSVHGLIGHFALFFFFLAFVRRSTEPFYRVRHRHSTHEHFQIVHRTSFLRIVRRMHPMQMGKKKKRRIHEREKMCQRDTFFPQPVQNRTVCTVHRTTQWHWTKLLVVLCWVFLFLFIRFENVRWPHRKSENAVRSVDGWSQTYNFVHCVCRLKHIEFWLSSFIEWKRIDDDSGDDLIRCAQLTDWLTDMSGWWSECDNNNNNHVRFHHESVIIGVMCHNMCPTLIIHIFIFISFQLTLLFKFKNALNHGDLPLRWWGTLPKSHKHEPNVYLLEHTIEMFAAHLQTMAASKYSCFMTPARQ